MKYVILNVGEESWFTASQILPKGRIGLPGTGSLSDIDQIVGHMGVEEILKGLSQTLGGLSSEIESGIRQYAQLSPRILKG